MANYTELDIMYWTDLRYKIETQVMEETTCEISSEEFENEVDVEFLYRFGFDFAEVLDPKNLIPQSSSL